MVWAPSHASSPLLQEWLAIRCNYACPQNQNGYSIQLLSKFHLQATHTLHLCKLLAKYKGIQGYSENKSC